MKMRFKRLAISAAAVGALASGFVAVSAAPAMAAPCGLSYTIGDVPGGPLKIVYYTIRNCHSYSVDRKMDYALPGAARALRQLRCRWHQSSPAWNVAGGDNDGRSSGHLRQLPASTGVA